MKKESLLILFAGIVFGAVVGFILTREHYEKKLADMAAKPAPRSHTQGAQAPPPDAFDTNQHDSMISQFIEEASQPGNLDAKVMLGNIYYDRGNFKAAMAWYEKAVALDDQNPSVLVDLGVCYRNLGEYEKALNNFDQALELEADKKQALYNRVVVLAFDLKKADEARIALSRLKDAYPDDPGVQKLTEEIEGLTGN